MKIRQPTDFETRVLRGIKRGAMIAGAKIVHVTAAARRLETLGYAVKSYDWYVTLKGDEYLLELDRGV